MLAIRSGRSSRNAQSDFPFRLVTRGRSDHRVTDPGLAELLRRFEGQLIAVLLDATVQGTASNAPSRRRAAIPTRARGNLRPSEAASALRR
jgi:hypothetical protein